MTPCNHCGRELADLAKFCAHCGASRTPLPEQFERARDEYARLRKEHEAGTLGSNDFEKALGNLAFEYQGHYWTIGAATGTWFMYDGQRWSETVVVGTPGPAASAATHPSTGGLWRYIGLIGFVLAAVAIVLPWYLDVSYYIGPNGSRIVLPAALFGAYGLSRKTTGMLTLATAVAGALIVGWALVASAQDEFTDSEEGIFLILVAGLAAVAGSVRVLRAERRR